MDDVTRLIKYELRQRDADARELLEQNLRKRDRINARLAIIVPRMQMGQGLPGDREEFDRLDAQLLELGGEIKRRPSLKDLVDDHFSHCEQQGWGR